MPHVADALREPIALAPGSRQVSGLRTSLRLELGTTFAVPAAAAGCRIAGEALELVLCHPPDPAELQWRA